ncbi:MAG TPA: apolipoprotein N-acyltransferase [Actinomycetales bacterium]|nr:apolipoprotein N-acyltransferase [Actinomycetales bacterium]
MRRRPPGLPLLLAAVGGLLTWGAFPGAGPWWAAVPGVALFYLAVVGTRPRYGAFLGLVYGVAFLLPHLSWAGIYVGWFPLAALVAAEALFYGLGGSLTALVSRHPLWLRAIGTASVWVALEAARARFPFGGFGWGRLAFSQADAPTLGLAALGGAPLVSFAVVLGAVLLAEAVMAVLRRRGALKPVVLLACVAAVLLVGLAVPRPTVAEDGTRHVAGIQGNVPRAGLDFNAERRAVLDNHAAVTQHLAGQVRENSSPQPDLVVWPENASDIDPLRNLDAHAVIDSAVADIAAPTLVGTLLVDDQGHVRNTTLVWDPATGPGEQYVKRHPVPFAEYVPYRDFFRRITPLVDLVRADMVAGDRVGVLDVAGTRVGDLICFEVVEDGLVADTVRNGAQLFVVQTNNATFGYTDESVQQLAMSRVRAVEHGRAVVHVSTVGVSAMIEPDGTVVDSSKLFTPAVLQAELPLRTSTTLATRLGAWPEALLAAGGILCAVAGTGAATRAIRRIERARGVRRGRGADA